MRSFANAAALLAKSAALIAAGLLGIVLVLEVILEIIFFGWPSHSTLPPGYQLESNGTLWKWSHTNEYKWTLQRHHYRRFAITDAWRDYKESTNVVVKPKWTVRE